MVYMSYKSKIAIFFIYPCT